VGALVDDLIAAYSLVAKELVVRLSRGQAGID